ncbi:MAG: ZIP family metal transporter [Nanoarchaeota archaeon]|nr:ZIP family metal transporter [Nanoarchaeota archaeon]MBU4124100.1 ZIP family metal transporter [Nanoarchaeota archaeon]
MLEIVYAIASVLLVSAISLVGVFTIFMRTEKLNEILSFLVSFAVGALLGDAFIHLIPEVGETLGFGLKSSLLFLSGIFLFFILEKFISWRHCHVPTSKDHPHPVGMMNIIGDGVHNFIDGTLIAGSYMVSIPLGVSTTIAILLHEIPQEIGDFGILIHAGYSKRKALLMNFATALAALLGVILTLIFGNMIAGLEQMLLPVAAGGFIYIAGTDLIPELHKETKPIKSLIQLLAMLLGIGIMVALLALEI